MLCFYLLITSYKKEKLRENPFTLAPKRIKYLGINLTKKDERPVQWKLQDIDQINCRRHK